VNRERVGDGVKRGIVDGQKTYNRRCTNFKCKQVSESTQPIFKCPFCGSSTVPVN
jgi:Zn finger protein HypA/HybF involved in hydrogenase expression